MITEKLNHLLKSVLAADPTKSDYVISDIRKQVEELITLSENACTCGGFPDCICDIVIDRTKKKECDHPKEFILDGHHADQPQYCSKCRTEL